jgi:hypothetical protein
MGELRVRVLAGTLAKRRKPRIEFVRRDSTLEATDFFNSIEIERSAISSESLSKRVPSGRTSTEQSRAHAASEVSRKKVCN